MKYTLVLQLSGPLAKAVAVEWTDFDAPVPDGTGWEPCIRLAEGRWRFASREGSAARPHLRDPGVFGNLAIRYRLEAAGPWSETSAERKEITIVAEGEDGTSPPPPVVPALIGGLGLAGSGKIGSPVAAEPGLWSGAPTSFAFQWCRDGAAIAGATEAAYTPVAEDDLTALSCRVTATGAGGQDAAETAALRITHVAPTAKGGLFDEIFDQGSGVQLVETAWDFIGEALLFAVKGAGATVDPETGVIGIPTELPLAGEVVTVTATNSGGSAASAFPVTVEEAPDLLVPLAAEDWEIVELDEDPVHAGMATAVIRFAADSPAADAVAAYWTDVNDPAAIGHPTYDLGLDAEGRRRFRMRPAWKDENTWHVRAPGQGKNNIAVRYRLEPLVTDTGSHMDHTLEENWPLVSENSDDRKGFDVPADFFGPAPAPKDPAPADPTPADPARGTPTPTTARSSITLQPGCVVSFNKSLQCGQFWDGSWFVVNPAGSGGFAITAWTPNGSGGQHGVMVNPRGGQNGFESTQKGSSAHHLAYSASHDKAPNRSGTIAFAAGEEASVVKCISVTTEYTTYPESWRGWHTDQERHFCLTVLKAVPPSGSFRPAAHGGVTSKAPIATIHDIDWSRIPSLAVSRLPHLDRDHLTLENCITNFCGEAPRSSGNFNGQIHHLFTIRSQSQLARRNSFGGLASYGSYWGQMAQAAMVHIFASTTPRASRELLLHGLVQFGLEVAQTAAVESAGEFHGPTFGHTALAGLCTLKDAALRNKLIGQVRGNSRLFDYGDKYRYISSAEIAGGSREVCPLEGRDPRSRRHNAGGQWPMDFPFLPGHVGMPHYLASFTTTSNADYGAKLDTWKAKQYNMEMMVPFFVAQFEGGADAIGNDIVLQWIDRYMYWWRGHYTGLWEMPTSDSEEWRMFDADWRVHRSFYEFFDAYRGRVPRAVWKGQPEQPFAPILTKSGSTITVEVGEFRCGNGHALTKGQYRVRQSSSRSGTGGWSAWTDFPLPPAGKAGTFAIPGRPAGANQVQIRYVNAAGAGPESLNIPYRADGADAPGRQPAGNLAQITI